MSTMSRESRPSRFRTAFDAVLREYEKITNITLASHPIAEKLNNCHSVESIILFIQDLAREFGDFPGIDRIMKSTENSVSVLSTLAAIPALGNAIGISFPPIKAIQIAIAILLNVTKGVKTNYKPLLDLFESIEHLLQYLVIYTQIPPTPAMDEIVAKIMVEILITLALMTKDLNQGQQEKFVKKIFGEKDVEGILQRLDRLSNNEARTTAVEIFKVIYGLIRDINGKATSSDSIRDSLGVISRWARKRVSRISNGLPLPKL